MHTPTYALVRFFHLYLKPRSRCASTRQATTNTPNWVRECTFLRSAELWSSPFYTAKSSKLMPASIRSRNHTGFMPRPAQVLPCSSRYLIGAASPLRLPLPGKVTLAPMAAAWASSCSRMRACRPVTSRAMAACSSESYVRRA